MKVICISGKANYGKDFTANLIKERLELRGNNVKIVHYADLLKHILRTFFSWDGIKNEEGRKLMQVVGTDTIRHHCPDYWVNFIIDILKFFPDDFDYVLISDTRFPNEIDKMKENFDTVSLRIERPEGFENSLTDEQRQHESEVALDNYKFDFRLLNTGDEAVSSEIDRFMNYLWKESDAK